MTMSSILLSALRAHEILQANAASNVANMNTPGYKALRTTLTASAEGAVDVSTTRSDEPAPLDTNGNVQSNTDLAREITDMMRARHGFQAILEAISSREDMLDDLMNTLTRR